MMFTVALVSLRPCSFIKPSNALFIPHLIDILSQLSSCMNCLNKAQLLILLLYSNNTVVQ